MRSCSIFKISYVKPWSPIAYLQSGRSEVDLNKIAIMRNGFPQPDEVADWAGAVGYLITAFKIPMPTVEEAFDAEEKRWKEKQEHVS